MGGVRGDAGEVRGFLFFFVLMECQLASKPELFETSTGKKLDHLWAEFVATQTKSSPALYQNNFDYPQYEKPPNPRVDMGV